MRLLATAILATGALQAADYKASIDEWRRQREERLKAPDGWLSVSGLHWLKPGANPLFGGIFKLKNNQVSFNGKTIQADSEEFVEARGVKLFVIHRGERFGIRVRDNNSDIRKKFTKLEWFPVDPKWRIDAMYTPYPKPRKVFFNSMTGDKEEMILPGYVELTAGGKKFRLTPVLQSDQLFLVFRDTTAGKSTYAAARFLYAVLPKAAGPVEFDFNKSYNPPCVFTPYATCPLPPKENRMDIAIEAGEKKYAGH